MIPEPGAHLVDVDRGQPDGVTLQVMTTAVHREFRRRGAMWAIALPAA